MYSDTRTVPAIALTAAVVLCFALPSPPAGASDEVIPFDDEYWEFAGEVVEHLGAQAVRGAATLKDVTLGDGIIEVEVAVDGRRSFPGIQFRMQDPQNTELFYIRPHRAQGYSHALQYSPVYNGMTAWQLYSGHGFTATAEIPWNRWIPIRIELLGARARVFFGDMERPALTVDRLVRGAEPGAIALTGEPGGQVHWANFRCRAGTELDFGPVPIKAPAEKMIRDWEISQAFPLAGLDRKLPPDSQVLGEITWQQADPDVTGLVNVSRLVAKRGRQPECVYARTTIEVDAPTVMRLDFGYSDDITVFLNQRPLFFGESSFGTRDSEFMGIVGLNDTLFLSLERGRNELVFSVAEGFGGWGFMARLEPAAAGAVWLAEGVTAAWTVAQGLAMPESVTVDEPGGVVYVSNMNPVGEGFVARLALDGAVKASQWATGLQRPTGMALAGDRLLVVERPGLAAVDISSGKIAERWACEGAVFLNDVAVDASGTAYVTDSAGGAIYRLADGVCSEWLRHPALVGPNGVWVDDAKLLVGCSNSGAALIVVDRSSRAVERIIDISPCACDGVISLGDGRTLVSDFRGRVHLVDSAGGVTVLVDSWRSFIGTADIGYAAERQLVVAPSLHSNTLAAYDLSRALGKD